MKILALDVGDKRIGVAISDATRTIAQPLTTLEKDKIKDIYRRIFELIKKHQVNLVVIGLPYNLNGSMGQKAKEILEFKEKLKNRVDADVKTYDERYSSKIAESLLIEQDISRKKRKKRIDKLAAQIILQDYLDYTKNLK